MHSFLSVESCSRKTPLFGLETRLSQNEHKNLHMSSFLMLKIDVLPNYRLNLFPAGLKQQFVSLMTSSTEIPFFSRLFLQ